MSWWVLLSKNIIIIPILFIEKKIKIIKTSLLIFKQICIYVNKQCVHNVYTFFMRPVPRSLGLFVSKSPGAVREIWVQVTWWKSTSCWCTYNTHIVTEMGEILLNCPLKLSLNLPSIKYQQAIFLANLLNLT